MLRQGLEPAAQVAERALRTAVERIPPEDEYEQEPRDEDREVEGDEGPTRNLVRTDHAPDEEKERENVDVRESQQGNLQDDGQGDGERGQFRDRPHVPAEPIDAFGSGVFGALILMRRHGSPPPFM